MLRNCISRFLCDKDRNRRYRYGTQSSRDMPCLTGMSRRSVLHSPSAVRQLGFQWSLHNIYITERWACAVSLQDGVNTSLKLCWSGIFYHIRITMVLVYLFMNKSDLSILFMWVNITHLLLEHFFHVGDICSMDHTSNSQIRQAYLQCLTHRMLLSSRNKTSLFFHFHAYQRRK